VSRLQAVREKWNHFLEMPFPKESATLEPNEVCLIEVDAAAAGCIHCFSTDGSLDEKRIKILESCTNEIQAALPTLDGHARDYFLHLKELCVSVLKETRFSK